MASQEIVRADPSKELVAQVRSDQFIGQLELALPPTVDARRFARIAVTAIQQNPDLAKCTRESVAQALLRCAADGLLPDGREAAITKFGDEATYMPMIGGYRKIAGDHGWILRTAVVYANDEFDYTDEPPSILHRSVRPGMDRGDLFAAYAVATHKDGRRIQMVLHPEDVAKRKAMAKTKKVWDTWPAAMWEKSAGRDLFGQLPLSDRDLIERVLAADVEPADAAEMLYGPSGRAALATPALPADGPAATPTETLSSDDGANGGGNGQQAAAAPLAAAVPDPDDEEEPTVFTATPDLAVAAAEVADTQIPAALTGAAGVNQGRTLAEVAEAGYEGEQWFGYAYRHPQKYDDGFNATLHTYLQGAKPELWAELTAEEAA